MMISRSNVSFTSNPPVVNQIDENTFFNPEAVGGVKRDKTAAFENKYNILTKEGNVLATVVAAAGKTAKQALGEVGIKVEESPSVLDARYSDGPALDIQA